MRVRVRARVRVLVRVRSVSWRACSSRISPLYLPCISPVSPLYLPYISARLLVTAHQSDRDAHGAHLARVRLRLRLRVDAHGAHLARVRLRARVRRPWCAPG